MLLPHIAARVFGAPLMISRAKLDVILSVLTPRLQGESLSVASPALTRGYEVTPDGVSIIPILGTLVRRTVGLEAQSGLSSYVNIGQQIKQALADNAVKAILLDVDSPGGEAGGAFDLADEIYAARDIKPIWAVANEEAFSAAYVLAAAATKIYISQTGGVGSIGVIAMHLDQSQADADDGLKYTAIYAGAHKNDCSPHDPLSDPAKAVIQTEVNRVYGLFVNAVARMRGQSVENVQSTEAALYFGDNAVAARLADKLGTFDDALNDLTASLVPKSIQLSFSSNKTTNRKAKTMTNTDKQPAIEAENDVPNLEALSAEFQEKAKAEARAEALAYVTEVNDLCALAGQSAKASDFIAKAIPVAEVRRALLTAKAAEAESSAIVGLISNNQIPAEDPTINTAAIYASRNNQKGN